MIGIPAVVLSLASQSLAAPFQTDLYCTTVNNLWVMGNDNYKDWPGFDGKQVSDDNFIFKPTKASDNFLEIGKKKIYPHTLSRVAKFTDGSDHRLYRQENPAHSWSLRLGFSEDKGSYYYTVVEETAFDVRLRTGTCYETE